MEILLGLIIIGALVFGGVRVIGRELGRPTTWILAAVALICWLAYYHG